MNARLLLTTLLALTAFAETSAAQSLAEVARAEADRRTQVASGKRYTNVDLRYEPPPVVIPAPAVATAPAASANGPADAAEPDGPIAAREKRDDAYWKTRSAELVGRVQQAREREEAAEARLSALETAPSSPSLLRELQVTSDAVARMRRDFESTVDEMRRFEKNARAAKVSPGLVPFSESGFGS